MNIMTTQIDFNTIINTLFTSALQPLQDEIQTLKDKIVKQDEFLAMWNFNGEEAFKKSVLNVVMNSVEIADFVGETVRYAGESNIEAAVEKAIDNMDLSNDVASAVEKELDNFDFDEKIKSYIEDNVSLSCS
jgi:hypothetical protein